MASVSITTQFDIVHFPLSISPVFDVQKNLFPWKKIFVVTSREDALHGTV